MKQYISELVVVVVVTVIGEGSTVGSYKFYVKVT